MLLHLFELYKINVHCDILLFVIICYYFVLSPPNKKWVATYQLTTTGLEYQSKLPFVVIYLSGKKQQVFTVHIKFIYALEL